jgi:hypothetical protein
MEVGLFNKKLENATTDDREKIFPEILSNAIALTTDVFGNYVMQKVCLYVLGYNMYLWAIMTFVF